MQGQARQKSLANDIITFYFLLSEAAYKPIPGKQQTIFCQYNTYTNDSLWPGRRRLITTDGCRALIVLFDFVNFIDNNEQLPSLVVVLVHKLFSLTISDYPLLRLSPVLNLLLPSQFFLEDVGGLRKSFSGEGGLEGIFFGKHLGLDVAEYGF